MSKAQASISGSALQKLDGMLPRGILGLLNRKRGIEVQSTTEGSAADEIDLADPSIDRLRPMPAASAATNGAVMLAIDHLTCRFGGLVAIGDLSMRVGVGTIHALIGPNGAGKSTFINLISGVYDRQEGQLTFDDRAIKSTTPWKLAGLGIARTFQNLRSFHSLSVIDNVLVGCGSAKASGWVWTMLATPSAKAEEVDLRATAEVALRFVRLWAVRDVPVSALPHEQQRMVEIARALAMRPKMVLLDEPAAGMNPTEVERLVGYIHKMKAIGITVLIVEHNMPFVMRIADRITVLNFGKKIAEGLPAEIRSNPEVISAYLGKRGVAKDIQHAIA